MSKIAEETFSGCTDLKVVSLPSGVDEIQSSAFKGCKNLNTVNIKSGVSCIGESAFEDCTSLMKISIGDDANILESNVFNNCSSLILVDKLNQDDASHPFNMVGDRAFSGTNLSRVNLSLRSSSIYSFWGDYCFANCHSLVEANILSSCYMSNHMFANCENLSKVNFLNN